ncbi:DHS-like NAD/FAD-binding domain-containing protein, partial [Paraphoma chrysanthemicola]
MDTISQEDVRRAFDDLARSQRIIVIAGAGMGTSRGIPDFRSKTGLFGKSGGKDSFDITQVYQTKASTDRFYKLVQTIHQAPSEEIPSIYKFFKALQDKGCLLRIYQQNIDGLDARILESDVDIPVKPPWKTVIRMHGDVSVAKCDTCHTKYPAFDPMRYSSAEDIPCDACSHHRNVRASSNRRPMRACAYQVGKLLPWVVMYNEHNPDLEAISNCSIHDLKARPDAIIVIGTTLRIQATHTLARVLCLTARRRKLPTFWISNEMPAKKD